MTEQFAKRHRELWEMLRRPYGRKLVPLHAGERLQFHDDIVRAAFTVHYRAAKWLTEYLVGASRGRRGHVLAPAQPREHVIVPLDFVPPPLLLAGDHELSLSVVTKAEYSNQSQGTR